jgi:hypothetical protein
MGAGGLPGWPRFAHRSAGVKSKNKKDIGAKNAEFGISVATAVP